MKINKLLVLLTVLDQQNNVVGEAAIRNLREVGFTVFPTTEGSDNLPLYLSDSHPAAIVGAIVGELLRADPLSPSLVVWVNSQFPDFALATGHTVVVAAHRVTPVLTPDADPVKLQVVSTGNGVRLVKENQIKLVLNQANTLAGYNLTVPPAPTPGDSYINSYINELEERVIHTYGNAMGRTVQVHCTRDGNPVRTV